jgi:hypothetical protein
VGGGENRGSAGSSVLAEEEKIEEEGGNPYRRRGWRGTREGASPGPSEGRGLAGGIEASDARQADVTRAWCTEGEETDE